MKLWCFFSAFLWLFLAVPSNAQDQPSRDWWVGANNATRDAFSARGSTFGSANRKPSTSQRATNQALLETISEYESLKSEVVARLPQYSNTRLGIERWRKAYGRAINGYLTAIGIFESKVSGELKIRAGRINTLDREALGAAAANHFRYVIMEIASDRPRGPSYADVRFTAQKYIPFYHDIRDAGALTELANQVEGTYTKGVAQRRQARALAEQQERQRQIAARRDEASQAASKKRAQIAAELANSRALDRRANGGPNSTARFGKIVFGSTSAAQAKKLFSTLAPSLIPSGKYDKYAGISADGKVRWDCYQYTMPYNHKRQICLFTASGKAVGMRFDGGGVNCGGCNETPIIENFVNQGFVRHHGETRDVRGMSYEVIRLGKGNLRMHYHRGLGQTTTTKRRNGLGTTFFQNSESRRMGGICIFQFAIESSLPRPMKCKLYG